MVFPLIPVIAIGGTALVGGGIAWGAKEFGEEAGKKTGTLLVIAVIGFIAFMILKKGGKV